MVPVLIPTAVVFNNSASFVVSLLVYSDGDMPRIKVGESAYLEGMKDCA
jgi:hypothetical protein